MPCFRDPVQRLGLDYDNLRGETLETKMLYLMMLRTVADTHWETI